MRLDSLFLAELLVSIVRTVCRPVMIRVKEKVVVLVFLENVSHIDHMHIFGILAVIVFQRLFLIRTAKFFLCLLIQKNRIGRCQNRVDIGLAF